MAFRGVISDLDGVIVNTVPVHFKAWHRTFAEFGVDFTFDDYLQKVDGIRRTDGVRNILVDWDEKDIRKAAKRKQELFLELIQDGVETYPSTIILLENLKTLGLKLAAISSSMNCETILRSIGIYHMFDTVVMGNDITKGKPDPQIFLTAAQRMGMKPDNCIVFEDAKLGVEAAKKGSFFCVGIDRNGSPGLLTDADIIVKDLAEIDFNTFSRLFIKS